MRINRRNIVVMLALAVSIAGCAIGGSRTRVPFGQADVATIRESARTVVLAHDAALDQGCDTRAVSGIETLTPFADGRPQEERWTLNRCGKTVHWRVHYNPKPTGSFGVRTTPEN